MTFSVLPLYNAQLYPPEVVELMYGDLTSLDHLYLPEDDLTSQLTKNQIQALTKMDSRKLHRDIYYNEFSEQGLLYEMENVTGDGDDATEYNEATMAVKPLVYRKSKPIDIYALNTLRSYGADDARRQTENERVNHLSQVVSTSYLYHARFEIDKAFKQREPLRKDKRYRMGYLFNRLRRLKTEMRKVIAMAEANNTENLELALLMRSYEMVVRYDVDIQDTVVYLQKVFNKPSAYDIVTTPDTIDENEG